jgi:hypothetical protein
MPPSSFHAKATHDTSLYKVADGRSQTAALGKEEVADARRGNHENAQPVQGLV